MPQTKTQGFTLIEVLIAALILFLVIAIAAQSFQGAADASLKAERSLLISQTTPLIMPRITQALQQTTEQDHNGALNLLGVEFFWQAAITKRYAPPKRFDPTFLEFTTYDTKFNLWRITLTAKIDQYERQWIYQDLITQPRQTP